MLRRKAEPRRSFRAGSWKRGNQPETAVFPFFDCLRKKSAENVTFCRPKTSKWCNCKTKEIFVAWQGKEKTDGTGNFGEKGKARR